MFSYSFIFASLLTFIGPYFFLQEKLLHVTRLEAEAKLGDLHHENLKTLNQSKSESNLSCSIRDIKACNISKVILNSKSPCKANRTRLPQCNA